MDEGKKRKKRMVFPARPYEVEAIERFLEDAAAKGWMLIERSGVYYVFEECEPVKIRFKVDFYKEGSKLDGEPSFAMSRYIEYFKSYGWQHVYSLGKIQILCASEGTPWPVESNEKSKLTMTMKITLWSSLVFNMLYAMMAAIGVFYELYSNILHPQNYHTYSMSITDGVIQGIICIMALYMLYSVVCAVRFGIFVTSNKRRIKKGLTIRYFSSKHLKRFGIFSEVIWLLLLIILLSSLWLFSKVMMVVTLLIALCVIGVNVLFHKLFPSRRISIVLAVSTVIGMAIWFVCLVGGFFVFPILSGDSTIKTGKNNIAIYSVEHVDVTLNELGFNKPDNSMYEETVHDSQVSLFGKLEEYSDTYVTEHDILGYSLELFTSRFTSVMDTYNNLLLTDNDYSLSKISDSENNWNAQLVYCGKKYGSNMYVVFGEDLTLVITGELNSTQAAALSSYYIK